MTISWRSHSDMCVVFYLFIYRKIQKHILVHVFSKFSYLTCKKDLICGSMERQIRGFYTCEFAPLG